MRASLLILVLAFKRIFASSIEVEVGLTGNLMTKDSCGDAEPERCAEIDRSDCILQFADLSTSCRKTCMLCDNQVAASRSDAVQIRSLYSPRAHQLVLKSDEDMRNKTLQVIANSDKYMHAFFTDDEVKESQSLYCVNKHSECSYWAASGECSKNPRYMELSCAPACGTCRDHEWEEPHDARCALPINVDKRNAFKPGDLNKMFTKIVTKDYPDRVEIHSGPRELTGREDVNDGPWLVTIDDFLSDEECDHLIELGDSNGFARSTQFVKYDENGKAVSEEGNYRTSSTVWCNEVSCFKNSTVANVKQKIQQLTDIPVDNYEHLQMLRYHPNQYYKRHHDYIPEHLNMLTGPRLLTVFLYLNDVEVGGGTDFPVVGKKVMPKRGRVVVWPSVLDQEPSKIDPRTDHEATPVEKGVKYAANAWIHARDFLWSFNNGCV